MEKDPIAGFGGPATIRTTVPDDLPVFELGMMLGGVRLLAVGDAQQQSRFKTAQEFADSVMKDWEELCNRQPRDACCGTQGTS